MENATIQITEEVVNVVTMCGNLFSSQRLVQQQLILRSRGNDVIKGPENVT